MGFRTSITRVITLIELVSDDLRTHKVERLLSNAITIVIKVTDQCNLGCGYCYYYAGENAPLRTRKEKNTSDKLQRLAEALIQSKEFDSFSSINIALHGGEPLLVGREAISGFMDKLIARFGRKLHCGVQTNGILLDDEWIELFASRNIHIGISIDAIEQFHNERRPFLSGKGSYNQCLLGIRAMQASRYATDPDFISTISVFDPRVTAEQYFEEIVDKWGVYRFDVLIPDEMVATADSYSRSIEVYDKFISEMWIQYLKRNDTRIEFAFFDRIFRGVRSYNVFGTATDWSRSSLVVADLAGGLFFDDTLRHALPNSDLRVGDWLLGELDDAIRIVSEWNSTASEPPLKCKACRYLPSCGGGPIMQRYSPLTRAYDSFVYCNSTKQVHRGLEALKAWE